MKSRYLQIEDVICSILLENNEKQIHIKEWSEKGYDEVEYGIPKPQTEPQTPNKCLIPQHLIDDKLNDEIIFL